MKIQNFGFKSFWLSGCISTSTILFLQILHVVIQFLTSRIFFSMKIILWNLDSQTLCMDFCPTLPNYFVNMRPFHLETTNPTILRNFSHRFASMKQFLISVATLKNFSRMNWIHHARVDVVYFTRALFRIWYSSFRGY